MNKVYLTLLNVSKKMVISLMLQLITNQLQNQQQYRYQNISILFLLVSFDETDR